MVAAQPPVEAFEAAAAADVYGYFLAHAVRRRALFAGGTFINYDTVCDEVEMAKSSG